MSTLKDFRETVEILSKRNLNLLAAQALTDVVNVVNASMVDALPDKTELTEKAENYLFRLKKYV